MTLYPNLVLDALRGVRYPGNGKSIVDLDMVHDIRIDGDKLSFVLTFDKPTDPFAKSLLRSAETAIRTIISPDIVVTAEARFPETSAPKPEILPGVKNIIGISSGKGGVGKSTVSANLAVALAASGYKVGLLDADIFGPSMPKMFGVEEEQLYMVHEEGRDWIEPIERYGVKMLSIGFLVDREKPVLWRGSMASNALKQLLTDAWWGELDYFLIDMPPGTSDIHLTLVQTVGITGVIVVTTPQEVALADARKGVAMFTDPKVNVPVLGIVENMAWFTPAAHPDERYYIFGREGGVRLAEKENVPVLAQIPLVMDIREQADGGEPVAVKLETDPSNPGPEAEAFRSLASGVVDAVERRNAEKAPTSPVAVTK